MQAVEYLIKYFPLSKQKLFSSVTKQLQGILDISTFKSTPKYFFDKNFFAIYGINFIITKHIKLARDQIRNSELVAIKVFKQELTRNSI